MRAPPVVKLKVNMRHAKMVIPPPHTHKSIGACAMLPSRVIQGHADVSMSTSLSIRSLVDAFGAAPQRTGYRYSDMPQVFAVILAENNKH